MPRLKLRNKLLLFSLLLALIPIGVAGRTLIRITQAELKTFTNEEIVLTAEQLAREIDGLVEDAWLPALLILRDTFEDEALDANSKMAVLQSSREIPDVVALEVAGQGLKDPLVILHGGFADRLKQAGLAPGQVLPVSAERLERLRQPEGAFVGDPVHLPETDDWLLTIVLPVESSLAGRSATLSARIDLRRLREWIEGHRFNQTGSIAVADVEGRQLFDPQRTDLGGLELFSAAQEILTSGSAAAAAMPYTRPSGEKMLGGYAVSRQLPWVVLVERSEARAYTAIRTMIRSLGVWVSLGFVVAVAGAFVFAARIGGPIVEIERVAKQVGEGNFDVRVGPIRSRDEIADLAAQINGMIEGLIERERVKSENVMLVELTEKLKALNEQKNKFLGMAAHDLRNPIGATLGYSEMLLEGDLTEDDRTLVSKIEASSKFMLRLLNDLLDLSQIESGKLELHLEDVDLAALVKENAELNRIIAGKKNIKLDLISTGEPPRVRADPSKIEQVLSNLISNAIKYSFPDTTIRVFLESKAGEAIVRVQDQGQGIPAAELSQLFQEFQKTSVQSTGGEKSTGLGLAIVKKVVEGHGGRIGVESEVGQGSTFYVSLPLAAADEGGEADRKEHRVEAGVPVFFSVLAEGGGSQAGTGTALDLSRGGTLIEPSVPLKVGDEIRFTLRLPGASVVGQGKLVRQLATNRFGVSFQQLDGDGEQQIERFIAGGASTPSAS
jgi:signal transduction histidine kinase